MASLVIRPAFPFTELAIDPMRPESRDANRKHPLNRNPVPLVPSAVFRAGSHRDNKVSLRLTAG